ncbi:zinc-binding domain-containing protein [Aspergillus karnatakaensis]|uniref:3CxxC-type zinc finger protein n=1 Tax=Aspergillus karnatakaensis TaxID=1810916 RepID=UPI003CCE064D
MARKKTFSMQPYLHADVADLLESTHPELDFTFYPHDSDADCIKACVTNIMGSFGCYNPSCFSTGWGSKKIAVTIRLYEGEEYNVRVYHQRCMKCNFLGRPKLDAECYAERVVYWLKKWSGVHVKHPGGHGKSKKPHQKRFCEGCKVGCCIG